MVNVISHKIIGQHLVDLNERMKSEKRFNLSSSDMSSNVSTCGSEAELSPRSEGEDNFSTKLNVILEKGESMYEPTQHLYTDDEVDNLRA